MQDQVQAYGNWIAFVKCDETRHNLAQHIQQRIELLAEKSGVEVLTGDRATEAVECVLIDVAAAFQYCWNSLAPAVALGLIGDEDADVLADAFIWREITKSVAWEGLMAANDT